MRQSLRFDNASLMQAVVAGLKAAVRGRVVVEVVARRTVVDVVVGGRVEDEVLVEVVVGGRIEDEVLVEVVEVVVEVVVVVTSPTLAQLVRQSLKARRQTATLPGCAQALRHAPKATVVAVAHAASPWQRAPAFAQLF